MTMTDHTANVTKDLKKFNWEVFDRPPYSPDLAPSDIHLFQELKTWFGGQRFDANDELNDAVKRRISSRWRLTSLQKASRSFSRYDKCLNRLGDYVEK